MTHEMAPLVGGVATITSIVAASLWVYSAKAMALTSPEAPLGITTVGTINVDIGGKKADLLETLKLKSTWKARAVWVLAAAAILYGATTALALF